MPWSPRQCRYFETATARKAGVPEKMRRECHDQARGTRGYAKGGRAVAALQKRASRRG